MKSESKIIGSECQEIWTGHAISSYPRIITMAVCTSGFRALSQQHERVTDAIF